MPDLEIKDVLKAVTDVNTAFEAFKSANDENLAKRDVVTEEKLSKIEASIEAAQKIADEAVLAAKRASRVVTDSSGNEVDLDQKAADWARIAARRRGDATPAFDAEGMKGYRALMDKYVRKGEQALDHAELKALSVGSDPDGGYMVDPDTSGRTTRRIFETSPIRAYASVQVISTDALEGMFDNDEAGSGWVSETGGRPQTSTPQLGTWRIPVHEMYANPFATQKILDDAAVNMESWLADKVATKHGREENASFVAGSGTDRPRGFLTYADYTTAGAFEQGKIEQFDTGVNGAFAAAPNGLDVLIDAQYGLKAAYRANAAWFMASTAVRLARKLKDSDGAMVWSPSATAGAPSSLLGHPVVAFEDMPAPAAGSLSIAFADMREAYQIVDRQGIRVLRDPFSAKPYVQFYTTKRVGGDVVNFEAIKLVRFA